MSDYDEAVDRGVEWLDENGPAGWWERIDLETLNIMDADVCVLGQVFAQAAAEHGRDGDGYSWAFDTWGEYLEAESAVKYRCFWNSESQMQEAWVAAIEYRRVMVS